MKATLLLLVSLFTLTTFAQSKRQTTDGITEAYKFCKNKVFDTNHCLEIVNDTNTVFFDLKALKLCEDTFTPTQCLGVIKNNAYDPRALDACEDSFDLIGCIKGAYHEEILPGPTGEDLIDILLDIWEAIFGDGN